MIKLDNISKNYGEKLVLNNINLQINKGEVYGLVGKNGAGKTTLLNIIAGILSPSSGKCFVDNKIVDNKTIETGSVGYLPDLPNFFDYLTVKEYFEFLTIENKGINLEKIDSYNEFLNNYSKVQIKKLSRGNRQKLGIFSILFCPHKIILLDEPMSYLDPLERNNFVKIIKELKDNGQTILISTHILTDLENVCDKIGFLSSGKIAQEIEINNKLNNSSVIKIKAEDKFTLKNKNEINKIFNDFNVKISDDKFFISSKVKDECLNQNNIFQKLSLISIKISKVEIKNYYDLEEILEGVSNE